MITKQLKKVGNSQAVFLDKTLLSLIEANTETVFKITVEGKKLVLEPVDSRVVHDYAMKTAREVMKTQKAVLRKLAK